MCSSDLKTIRRDRVHERALLLLRYAKTAFDERQQQRAIDIALRYPNGLALNSLLAKAQVSRELIFHLIATKRMTTGPRLSCADSALVFIAPASETDNEDCIARWLGLTPWGQNV